MVRGVEGPERGQLFPTSPLPVDQTRPEPLPVFGRAAVPHHSALRDQTDELPVVVLPRPAPVLRVSWQRPSRASVRQLVDGWGLSALGLLVAFCGWGTWAVAGRGTLVAPIIGFLIVVVTGGGVFLTCRLVGGLVFRPIFKRDRRTARLAHSVTGLFLAAAGLAYLAHTSWIVQGLTWLRGIG
jgi:hypothetical protein